jgi:hypothetical protein
MKKVGEDKPIGLIIIHIYMEISQGNSPCVDTFISNKLKCHVFHFIFSLFPSIKLENRRANKSCPGGRAGTSGSGGTMRKGGRRVTVQKMCTHARKWESDTC